MSDDAPRVSARVTDLERHMADQDRTIQQLSDVMAEQGAMLDRVRQALLELKSRIEEMEEQRRDGAAPPPHY